MFFLQPNMTTQWTMFQRFKKRVKVIDLSADFRLSNGKLWQETYDSKHRADDLLPQAIYGLPEHSAEKIKAANLVAVPGCYPTASILGLLPVIPHYKKFKNYFGC